MTPKNHYLYSVKPRPNLYPLPKIEEIRKVLVEPVIETPVVVAPEPIEAQTKEREIDYLGPLSESLRRQEEALNNICETMKQIPKPEISVNVPDVLVPTPQINIDTPQPIRAVRAKVILRDRNGWIDTVDIRAIEE